MKKFKESEESASQDGEALRKTVTREIKILQQMRHENVVTLLDVFRHKSKLYLVFEYVAHTLLEELEKSKGGLELIKVKKFIWQLVKAIEYCHSRNIIHRDVKASHLVFTHLMRSKPENCLLTRSGVLKLCDFGFSRECLDTSCPQV